MNRSLFAMLLAGCSEDSTQLLVIVDSDLRVPEEVEVVHAAVAYELGSPPEDSRDFALNDVGLPFSFGVVPKEEKDGRVVVIVSPISGGNQLFESRAVTSFVEGKTLVLPMRLLASCAEEWPCEMPQTCREGRCASDQIDSSNLEEAEPGDELTDWMRPRPRTDAGMSDSGVSDSGAADTGIEPDAGTRDAMPMDAAMIDPNCSIDADCDQPNKCPMDAQDCVCRNTPMGMHCVATCSQANMMCPDPPTGETFVCNVNMGICVPM